VSNGTLREPMGIQAGDLARVADVVLAHIDERGWLPADRRAFAEAVADAALRAALGDPAAPSGARPRPMCVTIGHEAFSATTSGAFDDGTEQTTASYCGECTPVMTRDGEYTIIERFADAEPPAQSAPADT
jgi:hypothetical protein